MSDTPREYGVITSNAAGSRVERYPDADRGLCKSCRFWDQTDLPAGKGECILATSGESRSWDIDDEDPSEMLAVAVQNPDDLDEGGAFLITAANFGCVQWHGR